MFEVLRNIYGMIRKATYPIRQYLSKRRMVRQWDASISLRIRNKNVLTKEQKFAARKYFAPYIKDISLISHSFYTEKTGAFHVDYIPDGIYYSYIDKYYNDWSISNALDNKVYYKKMFPSVKQPETICYRCNKFWFTESGNMITEKDAIQLLVAAGECFAKCAVISMGGMGVFFIKDGLCNNVKASKILAQFDGDLIVQKKLEQTPVLSRLNASSVNTIRVVTLLNSQGEARVYSSILRMGINGSKVDNASAGGITCGIKDNGQLKSIAYSIKGDVYHRHPTSGVSFCEILIPRFSEIKELAARLALSVPHFRLVSWDFAIDYNNEIVLIEANLCYGQLDFHQLNNGPMFGKDQPLILKEVFGAHN